MLQVKKMNKEYKKLYNKLKKIPLPENNSHPDKEKMKEILSKKDDRYFNGPEMDGVNLSISSANAKLVLDAQKYCNHEFEVKYNEDYTGDIRMKLTRIVSCDKCGFELRKIVTEELGEKAFWW